MPAETPARSRKFKRSTPTEVRAESAWRSSRQARSITAQVAMNRKASVTTSRWKKYRRNGSRPGLFLLEKWNIPQLIAKDAQDPADAARTSRGNVVFTRPLHAMHEPVVREVDARLLRRLLVSSRRECGGTERPDLLGRKITEAPELLSIRHNETLPFQLSENYQHFLVRCQRADG